MSGSLEILLNVKYKLNLVGTHLWLELWIREPWSLRRTVPVAEANESSGGQSLKCSPEGQVGVGGWGSGREAWRLNRSSDDVQLTGTWMRSQPLENGGVDLVTWELPPTGTIPPAQRFPGQEEELVGGKGSSYSRYQTEPRKRRKKKRKSEKKAHEAEVSRPSARNNSINNRRRLVNTAVITPNIKQPRWHLAHRPPRAALGQRGNRVPGSSDLPLCLSQLNLPQRAVP